MCVYVYVYACVYVYVYVCVYVYVYVCVYVCGSVVSNSNSTSRMKRSTCIHRGKKNNRWDSRGVPMRSCCGSSSPELQAHARGKKRWIIGGALNGIFERGLGGVWVGVCLFVHCSFVCYLSVCVCSLFETLGSKQLIALTCFFNVRAGYCHRSVRVAEWIQFFFLFFFFFLLFLWLMPICQIMIFAYSSVW